MGLKQITRENLGLETSEKVDNIFDLLIEDNFLKSHAEIVSDMHVPTKKVFEVSDGQTEIIIREYSLNETRINSGLMKLIIVANDQLGEDKIERIINISSYPTTWTKISMTKEYETTNFHVYNYDNNSNNPYTRKLRVYVPKHIKYIIAHGHVT